MQILTIKLIRPTTDQRWVPKSRLISAWDNALGRRVRFISAPAGYGKTTRVAQMPLPMQATSSLARTGSPITAVIIAVSGLAKVEPFALVKRTSVPIAGGIVTVILLNYGLFF